MKMPDVGRLAFRAEGDFWNAYHAPSLNSMDGAVLLGSMRMSLVTTDPTAKSDFMQMMQAAFERALNSSTGLTVARWNEPQSAPEHERSGSA